MVKLRNIGTDVVSLYRPAGDPTALTVEPGQVVEVPGELADPQPHSDAVVIEHDDSALAFPASRWEVADRRPKAGASPVTDVPTSEG